MKKKFLKRSIKGGVMAETAMVIPMLLGITLFIVEFGNVLYLINSLNQIARYAARYAAVNPTASTTTLKSASNASAILPDSSNLTLTVSPLPSGSRSFGDTLTVTVSYTYTPILNPYALLQFSSLNTWSPTISSKASTTVEVTQ